jgi:hypothetical protein
MLWVFLTSILCNRIQDLVDTGLRLTARLAALFSVGNPGDSAVESSLRAASLEEHVAVDGACSLNIALVKAFQYFAKIDFLNLLHLVRMKNESI